MNKILREFYKGKPLAAVITGLTAESKKENEK